MQKKEQLKQFIEQKLKNLDKQYANQQNDMQRLKLTTMRVSYSKIMQTFLKSSTELPRSHYQQALFYFNNQKIQQAINQAQKAKRKLSLATQEQKQLSQQIDLLLVDCYIKNSKYEDALAVLDQIQVQYQQNKQKYLNLKACIYQKLNNESVSKQLYQQLHNLILKKYGESSVEQGLLLIKQGKNYGYFKSFNQGIHLIFEGMDILISNKYQNPLHVGKIYQTLATMCLEIQDYTKQYNALICAYSMIRQLGQQQQKMIVQIVNRLAVNLIRKQEKSKALEFLIKAEEIQRKIYGESSQKLAKTVRKIIQLMYELGRNLEAKRYENQYDHLLVSKINGKNNHYQNTNALNNSHSNSQIKNLAMSKVHVK